MSRYFPQNNNTSRQSAVIRILSLVGCWMLEVMLSVWRNCHTATLPVCLCFFFSNKSWQSLSEGCNVLSEKWKKCSDKLFLFSIHLISLFSQIFISCASRLILLSVRDGNESGNYFYIFINLFQFQTWSSCPPSSSPCLWSLRDLGQFISQWAHTWLGRR